MSLPVAVQLLLCPLVLIALLRTTAPYGRHFAAGWGPCLPGRTAWFLMELPGLLVIAAVIRLSAVELPPILWLPWLLWSLHYGYRTFVFPAMMRASGRTFPLLLVVFAWGFNALNGYNNAQALLGNAAAGESPVSWHFAVGTGLFLGGFVLHLQADAVIRRLRERGGTAYGIPRGGLFRWVTNPNYLGEIVEWVGWAVLTWSWAGLAFALFTACNLVPRALANHRWYQRRFPEYPPERKIILPFVY